METKEIITTLQAEPVNEAIIEKRNVGTRNESWPTYFDCKIAVKVGNVVKDISLCVSNKWDSEKQKYIKNFVINAKPFADLMEAGIEIDFSKVKSAYAGAIKRAIYAQEKEKKEAEMAKLNERTNYYDNESWFDSFVEEVENDKRNEMKEFKIEKIDREEYINSNYDYHVLVIYKGLTGSFYRELVNRETKFAVTNAKEYYTNNEGKKCSNTVYVTNSKMRHGKLAKSVVHRWFQDIDEYFAIQESTKKRNEKEKNDREEKVKFLSEASGEEVYAKHEYVSRRRDFGGDYYEWRYFMKIKPIGEEKELEFKVNYSDYYKSFSLAGLTLNQTQFKSVIDILKKKNI